LNALYRLDDAHFLLLALAAVEGDYLESVADVMVHVRNHTQAALNVHLSLTLTRRQHVDERARDQPDKQIRKKNQIAGGKAVAMEPHFQNVTAQGHDNQRNKTFGKGSKRHIKVDDSHQAFDLMRAP